MSGLLLGAAAVHALPPPERVRFASLERDERGPVEIEGLLFRPETARPIEGSPAVIALHGCGGLYGGARGREAELSERPRARTRIGG